MSYLIWLIIWSVSVYCGYRMGLTRSEITHSKPKAVRHDDAMAEYRVETSLYYSGKNFSRN